MATDERSVLLFWPSMENLAGRVQALSPSKLRLGKVAWGKFPDGTPNIHVVDPEKLRGRDVVFFFSGISMADLLPQLSVIYALPSYGVKSLKVVIPYYPFGTMERVEREGDIATAKTFARMVGVTPPLTQSGPAEVILVDIHALQEQFYFGDSVRVRLVSVFPHIFDQLPTHDPIDAVVFPDDGARKRFGKSLHKYQQIICEKVRDGDRRIVRIKEGDPRGKRVIIVDDLIQSGGTVIACAEALHQAWAAQVDAFIPHAVFPENGFARFFDGPVDNFYITESCPARAAQIDGQGPFKVISLAEVLRLVILD